VLAWLSRRRAARRAAEQRESIKGALLTQARVALGDGHRFQFRVEEIGGEDEIRRFVVSLTFSLGKMIRANCGDGLITVYGDDENDDGVSVVVATVQR
jgi:hypothetical protein